MKKIVYLVMVPFITMTMEEPKGARKIATEIVRLKKRKAIEQEEKRVSQFLQLPPQPECMKESMFDKIAQICTPENVPLMTQLIEQGIINVNTYKKIYGDNCTLLAVSIHNAIKNGDDFEIVELLLQKGAKVDSETWAHEMATNVYVYDYSYTTPLARATSIPLEYPTRARADQLIPLIRLLLRYKADLNRKSQREIPEPQGTTPFMNIVQKYINRDKDQKLQAPFYALIKDCLENYGASIDVESEVFCSRWVGSPLEYVKEKRATQLITLFEEHQRKYPTVRS